MSAAEQSTLGAGWDQPEEFRLTEERIGPGAVLIAVFGELDIATAPELRERLTARVKSGTRRVAIDLSGVTFMDSVAMAAIIHARTQLLGSGRMAIVVDPDSYTRLVFEIAGLPQCLDVVERREQAVAHITA